MLRQITAPRIRFNIATVPHNVIRISDFLRNQNIDPTEPSQAKRRYTQISAGIWEIIEFATCRNSFHAFFCRYQKPNT